MHGDKVAGAVKKAKVTRHLDRAVSGESDCEGQRSGEEAGRERRGERGCSGASWRGGVDGACRSRLRRPVLGEQHDGRDAVGGSDCDTVN